MLGRESPEPMRSSARHLPWIAWALVLGCGGEEGERWLPLVRAEGQPPAPSLESAVVPDGQRVDFRLRDGELWGEVTLARESWKPSEIATVLHAPAPLLGFGRPGYRLELDGRPARQAHAEGGKMNVKKGFTPDTFGCWHG